MTSMFYGCTSLKTIPYLNTAKCLNIWGMFSGCTNLETIPNLNIEKVFNMEYIFDECYNLETVANFESFKKYGVFDKYTHKKLRSKL